MIILIDMDSVITNFEKGVLKRFRELYPDKPYIPLEERKLVRVEEEYLKRFNIDIKPVYHSPNFFISLEPVEGSLEAITEMQQRTNVFICTSPLTNYENCISEKYKWIEKHLGKYWTKKLIVTKDKTVIRGDFLIDDRPEIEGVGMPTWEHIIYTQPYNIHITNKRRLTWNNWKDILKV